MARALAVDPVRAARARRGLAVYLALVLVGTAAFQLLLFRTHDPIDVHTGLVMGLMWTPGLASIITRLVLREGFGDVAFGFGGRSSARPSAVVWLYPLLVGTLAYGGAWLSGLEHFHVVARDGSAVPSQTLHFARRLFLTATLGVPIGAVAAAGEELGWRGFMITRLVDAGVRRPVLTSGPIWGLWHTPLILTGQYAAGPYPLLSAAVFVLSILPETYLISWARLASGSVWPAIVAHAAWNAIIQGAFDPSTAGGSATHTTSIWVGESGLLVVLASLLVAALLLPRRWSMRRSPSEAAVELGDALRL